MSGIRLSICIPTINRDRFIAETLDSILHQLVDGVEIVIVDGNHDHLTETAVAPFIAAGAPIRYVRSAGSGTPSNEGFDRDLDRAVDAARGEYCWLFTDDDTLVPTAIATVLNQLDDGEPELLIVDSEVRDVALDRVLEPRRLTFCGRRDYGARDGDRLMADAGNSLTFVGVVIIRRDAWLSRDRQSYYGSGFLHVCVIFQSPRLESARVLGESLVRIRMGNAAWSRRAFEIWMLLWPRLIWSFGDYSSEAKAKVTAREPWRGPVEILLYRAYGSLGRVEVKQHLAGMTKARDKVFLGLALALPGPVAHVAMTTLLAISRGRLGSVAYNLQVASPNTNAVSRTIGRTVGHRLPPRP